MAENMRLNGVSMKNVLIADTVDDEDIYDVSFGDRITEDDSALLWPSLVPKWTFSMNGWQ